MDEQARDDEMDFDVLAFLKKAEAERERQRAERKAQGLSTRPSGDVHYVPYRQRWYRQ